MEKQILKKQTVFIIVSIMFSAILNAQTPSIQWQKCIGGRDDEFIQNVIKLSDGNYLSCGSTSSLNGDFNAVHGSYDAFLLKTNGTGHIIWKKTYGGSDYDAFYNMVEKNNGDIVVIGATASNDGQVSGLHGSVGSQDVWLAKVNSNGTLLSQHCYGGSGDDYSIKEIITNQGNIMFAAITSSNDGDVSNNHGDYDGWVVKLNTSGAIDWSVTIGDTAYDDLTGLVQVSGGYIVSGITSPETGELAAPVFDAIVAKLNNFGSIVYYKKYGGSASDNSNAMVLSQDGNVVLTGHTDSNDGDVSANNGFNVWVFKIDIANNGNILWQNFFGIPNDTAAGFNLISTHDGGFVVAGSIAPNLLEPLKTWDAYAGKVDANGNLLWTKQFGGNKFDIINSLVEENDHSILMAGSTKSNNRDVHGNHGGPQDAWLVNYDGNGSRHHRDAFDNLAPEIISLNSFANPVSASTTISFSLTQSQNVSLRLFDVNGKLISTLANANFAEGENEIVFDAEKISAGIYFLKMQAGDFLKIERLIIAR
jgi:hypothetical protein